MLDQSLSKRIVVESGLFNAEHSIVYGEVSDRYAQSEYGRHHATQRLRFQPYSYSRGEMWQDLGDDVHPLLHMPHTLKDTVNPMLKSIVNRDGAKELSIDDIRTLKVTTLIHDIGENTHPSLLEACGEVVDDIPYWLKTDKDEQVEQAIRHHVFSELFSFIPDRTLNRADEIIMQSDPTDYAIRFFRAAENTGYYKTGIRAGELALKEKDKLESSKLSEPED